MIREFTLLLHIIFRQYYVCTIIIIISLSLPDTVLWNCYQPMVASSNKWIAMSDSYKSMTGCDIYTFGHEQVCMYLVSSAGYAC